MKLFAPRNRTFENFHKKSGNSRGPKWVKKRKKIHVENLIIFSCKDQNQKFKIC